jgi:hypothetical protein
VDGVWTARAAIFGLGLIVLITLTAISIGRRDWIDPGDRQRGHGWGVPRFRDDSGDERRGRR